MTLKIGLLAGEASGDLLGAGLMVELRKQAMQPVEFIGVGGQRMSALGMTELAPIEQFSVNGFREPIQRLPQLIQLYRTLQQQMLQAQVDGFVGIDFNVFNFLLESALKKRGIRTAHYVSPSVYAWRTGRTNRVAKSADLLMCLYPFEPPFYEGLPVNAQFVGHPLADAIAPQDGERAAQQAAREQLGITSQSGPILAVLPGSRSSEVRLHITHFLDAAEQFAAAHADTLVVIPCLRAGLKPMIEQALERHAKLPVRIYDGDARLVLRAADLGLIKSGTSTLEAMLLHRPMVVSYRLGAMTYWLAKRLVRTPFIALPNILSGRGLVPELIQEDGHGEALALALQQQWASVQHNHALIDEFHRLHLQLRQNADAKAAAAVLHLFNPE